MITNATIFRIASEWLPDLSAAEEALHAHVFVPCAPSQERSSGWAPPRGDEHGALIESIGGQWLLEYLTEEKPVPADVIRRALDERCAQIEAATGRKPGKRERKDLKQEIHATLLTTAFSRFSRVVAWIDPIDRRLVVGSASGSRCDQIVTSLVQALNPFAVDMVTSKHEPAAAMSAWLGTQEAPFGFTVDRECELHATGESKSVVRYAKSPLDTDEVRKHIADGMRATRLAMTYEDRVSFELTEGMALRKITFIDGVFDRPGDAPAQDAFDADAAIATGELRLLIPALVDALGGESRFVEGVKQRDAIPA